MVHADAEGVGKAGRRIRAAPRTRARRSRDSEEGDRLMRTLACKRRDGRGRLGRGGSGKGHSKKAVHLPSRSQLSDAPTSC